MQNQREEGVESAVATLNNTRIFIYTPQSPPLLGFRGGYFTQAPQEKHWCAYIFIVNKKGHFSKARETVLCILCSSRSAESIKRQNLTQ
jgi:hypothetical protein